MGRWSDGYSSIANPEVFLLVLILPHRDFVGKRIGAGSRVMVDPAGTADLGKMQRTAVTSPDPLTTTIHQPSGHVYRGAKHTCMVERQGRERSPWRLQAASQHGALWIKR